MREVVVSLSNLAANMREVVFAGLNVAFDPTLAARHKFGIRLIRAISTGMLLSEACLLHAMLLWTIYVSKTTATQRGPANFDICVACLIVCVKMQAMIAINMTRFATACQHMFLSRDHISNALEWTLKHETQARDTKVSHLTAVLKMMDSPDLVNEVVNLTCRHLRYAEVFLLFTSLQGQWYRYLIELYEYVRSKTHGMSSAARLGVVLEMCNAQDA
jgi:hypothetical protein